MKTAFFLFFLLLLYSVTGRAQQTHNNIIVKDLDVNGQLDVSSTTTASRPCPTMSEAQRDAVNTPATGSCIFNSTSGLHNFYDGDSWETIGATQASVDEKITGPAAAVDGEIALYDSTTGKLAKRATGTGFVKAASGVYSTQADIANADINAAAAIDASKIHNASVSNAEFAVLDSGIDLASEVGATVLPNANGGTGKALTPALGAVPYFDADSMEVLAAGTSGFYLKANGAGVAPSWAAVTATDGVTATNTGGVKTCYFAFGKSTGSLASPVACDASPCSEYLDTCNMVSAAPTRTGTGDYSMVIDNGSFANNNFIWAGCNRAGGSTFCISNTFATGASGGVSAFPVRNYGASTDTLTDSYIIIKFEGVGP